VVHLVSFYCENLTKQINTLCGEYVEVYNIKKEVKHKRVYFIAFQNIHNFLLQLPDL
jgi:hypothetical protein